MSDTRALDHRVRAGAKAATPGGRLLQIIPGVAVVVLGLPYLLGGPGFILDDWWALGNAHFDRWWMAAGPDQWLARPGAGVVYAVEFGLIGDHPAVIAVIQMAVLGATAILLGRLLATFMGEGPALLAATIWTVLPNHTSLEMWASTLNITISELLLVAGLLAVARIDSDRHRTFAVAALLIAGLCYEATIPLAAVGVVVIPWLRYRRIDRRLVVWSWITLGAASLWILVNWHPAKSGTTHLADPTLVLVGHFGSTVLGDSRLAPLIALVPVAGSALLGWAALSGAIDRHRTSIRLVASGWVVLVLGTIPFLFYFYSPLGAGDRVTVVSGIGGAMIWTGVIWEVGARRRAVAVALTAVFAILAITARAEMTSLYLEKADEAHAIVDGVVSTIEDQHQPIYVGPAPAQVSNVVAFLDRSNLQPALRLAYDDSTIVAYLTYDLATFEAQPPAQRLDVRTLP